MSRLLWKNPVLLRELQERVLSRRTGILISIWVIALCAVTALYYVSQVDDTFGNQFGSSVLRLATVGQEMFDWLLFFMIALVLFLVPGFTAASIAGERERQTLLPMQVTLLRPIDIVVGKVAASIVFVLVLISAATPVLAFAYIIGGITIRDVFASLAMLMFSALAVACLTVACSAFVRRVPAAIVTAYGMVLALAIGSLMIFGLMAVVDDSRGFDAVNPPLTVLAVNPVVALADVSDSSQVTSFGATPMSGLREMLNEVRGSRQGFGGNFNADVAVEVMVMEGPDGIPMPVPAPPGFPVEDRDALIGLDAQVENPNLRGIDRAIPYWLQYITVMTALSASAVWLSARRIRTPAKVER